MATLTKTLFYLAPIQTLYFLILVSAQFQSQTLSLSYEGVRLREL